MNNVKNYFTKQPQQIVSALILTGILSLSTGITLLDATAAPKDIFQDATGEMVKGKGKLISDRNRDREHDDEFEHQRDRNRERESDTDYKGRVLRLENQTATNLPKSVAEAVLQDASRRSRLPISDLRIVEAERRQWTDGCLGISHPGILQRFSIG